MCKDKERNEVFYEDENKILTEKISENFDEEICEKVSEVFIKGNVDRISEGYFVVILDGGSSIDFPVQQYPDLKPGQIITLKNFEIEVDEEATAELKKEVINLQNALFK